MHKIVKHHWERRKTVDPAVRIRCLIQSSPRLVIDAPPRPAHHLGSMKRYALPVVVLMCVAAAPATKPTTEPTSQPATPVQKAVAEFNAAKAALQSASKSVLDSLAAMPAYQAAVKDRDKAKAALDAARKDGGPTARMEASSAYNKARLKVEKLETDAANADPAIKQAKADMDTAKATYTKAYADQKAAEDERAAAIEAAKPTPPKIYAKGEELETGMTVEQVRQATGSGLPAKEGETETSIHYIFAISEPVYGQGSQVTRWYCTFSKETKKLVSYSKQ